MLNNEKTSIMNYKKLLSNCVSKESDSSKAIVALLAGLAVGAVLGVLFAPESGEETRSLIKEKANALTDKAKDKYQSVKDQVLTGKDELVDLKDRVVDQVKSNVDSIKDKIKGVSDDANDAVQEA